MIPLPSKVSSLEPLAAALDAATSEARVNWMHGLGSAELIAVWKLSDGTSLDIPHFHGAEGEVIIHEGMNSLPMFNRFQKRFMLRKGEVQGYNHQAMAWFTGPGHFTMFQTDRESGIDYVRHPADVPAEFPPLARNDSGLSSLVYGGTQDWCRRVARNVIIGEARKGVKPIGAYFMLIRVG